MAPRTGYGPASFPGFAAFPTHHCVTGSLRHIYEYHGYGISEDLLLGLGRGLGFVYFHIGDMDPFFGGRANVARPGEEGLEITAGRRTGVVVEAHTTGSARRAQDALRASLEAGEPVMVYLDMGFLPYFDLPEGYHFGAHVVVVAGCDPASQTVLLADRDAELHPVDWDTLEQARGSAFKPFPPLHKWFTFDFSSARPPTPEETREAIAEVCRGMLEPPIANLGVKGIRKARAETLKWPKLLDPPALRRTCANVAMFIDARGGTGGGIFRYMYARFLLEAASIVPELRLAGLAPDLVAVGDLWEEVAVGFTRAAAAEDPADLLDEATARLPEIADREEAFWGKLAETVLA
ncbi:MAG: DUF4872 domain-containing protein [Actinobacteria bacterium]|nr:DUF4872 domain-containing protein [Actinomycetota bacterium]